MKSPVFSTLLLAALSITAAAAPFEKTSHRGTGELRRPVPHYAGRSTASDSPTSAVEPRSEDDFSSDSTEPVGVFPDDDDDDDDDEELSRRSDEIWDSPHESHFINWKVPSPSEAKVRRADIAQEAGFAEGEGLDRRDEEEEEELKFYQVNSNIEVDDDDGSEELDRRDEEENMNFYQVSPNVEVNDPDGSLSRRNDRHLYREDPRVELDDDLATLKELVRRSDPPLGPQRLAAMLECFATWRQEAQKHGKIPEACTQLKSKEGDKL